MSEHTEDVKNAFYAQHMNGPPGFTVNSVNDGYLIVSSSEGETTDNTSGWFRVDYETTDAGIKFVPQADWTRGGYVFQPTDASQPWPVVSETNLPIPSPHAIKLVDETPEHYLVEGPGHFWGNPQTKDLAGDYFTPESDFMPDLVPVKLAFYNHTLAVTPDGKRFDHPIGTAPEAKTRQDDVAKWIQLQLDKRAEYIDAVMELVEKGVLSLSSGSIAHLVKRAKDGWLQRWPVVEWTLTTHQAEPRLDIVQNTKALQLAYKSAGLNWPVEAETGDAEGPQREGEPDEVAAAVAQARLRILKLR